MTVVAGLFLFFATERLRRIHVFLFGVIVAVDLFASARVLFESRPFDASIAPYDAHVLSLDGGAEEVRAKAERVAALFGAVAGAGYQIGLYCDLRVAHPEARIGQPEVKTGLGSILGTSAMDWHLPFGINAELSLLGELISGERAYQLGLVNRLVPKAQVLETALALARELAKRPPHAVRITKERMRELTQPQFDDILVAARKYQRRAYESGEPQRVMRELLDALRKR